MFHSSKPYSAVTVQIEVLTSEQYEVEDSSGIVDLIEAIRIQASGPTEASRALRKKLKYGNLHRQLRALTILDFLIQNTGDRFLREFADEPLLERLRIAATDPVSDPLVKEKCKQLFGQWAASYKNTPGMERVTGLYRQLPKRKQPATQAKAKVLRDAGQSDEPTMGHTVSVSAGNGPATVLSGPKHKHTSSKSSLSSFRKEKKEKKTLSRSFNLEKEKPEMLQTLASASVASTNLLNALKLVNRETHRVSEDAEVLNRFETCKTLRRQILRYIQHVESEEFLGSLIHANEELVTSLMAFEVLDKSVDYDSDSDQDVLETGWTPDRDDLPDSFAGLVVNPPKPPRPPRPLSISVPSSSRKVYNDSESETEDDDDEDNPFGDRNAIRTPGIEKHEPTWREV
ncbi:LSB5 family protein [Aspergillus luchuensis]|uniref:VHS domain protein n=2 Tax=Aspergillus subgen. Circumdati TaxID=2720871 RepID=A0A8G1QWU2_9EURO|nr:VHS domain protein [Aspergillus piperis CBS 112811]XP_041548571.1 putative actin patch assembly and actin polymerization protein [Aspergillus luchuensis]RAH55333.1 VHS domain protein [Aspergillus piperis CBS 112811]BCS04809.1 putative actin patch assembly and actin polymerization protein [Aspergillus luchuensis]BCS16375.1 putative actin patch assembly and actin polymerization protein [Aspergillus luchuensis]